jgi:hypothetical protein
VPYFITEWGWQNGGAQPTSGTLSGYGTPFSNYLETKGVSWTAWVFDKLWQPVMFDANWNLLGGENYMGQFTKDELAQHQNDNLPGSGGPTNTPPALTATRTNTPPALTATRTNTPPAITATRTRTNTPGGPTATRTRTPTRTSTPGGPTATRTNTPFGVTNTPTRTNTPFAITATPTTGGGGGACSPVSADITAPFVKDGTGTLCWRSTNLGGFINSWNTTSVTLNGTNVTNLYVASGSYPAKIDGYWYVTYNGPYAWSHFEAK